MMNRENAAKTLLEFKKILDEANIKFWLTCGVLLGAIRDSDFIPYDKDIDLIVLAKDWRPAILLRFEEEDFRVRGPIRLRKRGIGIDIFPYCYFAPKKVYVHPRRSHRFTSWYREIPRNSLETETFIEFLGEKFRILAESEKLLESIYGSTWRRPRRKGKDWKSKITFRSMPPRDFMDWILEHEKKNLWWRLGLKPSRKHG